MKDILAGVYRHYKGPLYLVLGPAHDENADTLAPTDSVGRPTGSALGTRNVIVYIELELNDAHTGPRMIVRTYEDFIAEICWREACENFGRPGDRTGPSVFSCSLCHTALRPRFEYIGPTWEGSS